MHDKDPLFFNVEFFTQVHKKPTIVFEFGFKADYRRLKAVFRPYDSNHVHLPHVTVCKMGLIIS